MLKRLSLMAVALLFAAIASHTTFAQDLTTAEDVIKANIEATGGEAAWNAVKDMHMVLEVNVETPMGAIKVEAHSWSIFPGYGFTEMSLVSGPDGIPPEAVAMKAYYTPLEGWVEQGGQRQDLNSLPPAARQQFQRSSPKAEMALLTDDVTMSLTADTTFSDRAAYMVSANQYGMDINYFYDQETLMMLGQTVAGNTTTVGDFEEINGLLFATSQVVVGAQGTQNVAIKTIELDGGVTPGELARKSGSQRQAVPE